MAANDVWILGGPRTPMGESVGSLAGVSAIELGAIAARAALDRAGTHPAEIEHVVMGNVRQTSKEW